MVCGKESKPKENKAFRGRLGDRTVGFPFDIKSFGDSNRGWFLLLAIGTIFFAFMILAVPAFGVANIIASCYWR